MKIRRPLLLPLVPLYGAVLAIKKQMFRWGVLKQRHLRDPVISVGSVSAGGAGKTPMVLTLAGILRRRGYAVNILTRGFGRGSDTVERVEPYGDAAWHGDEPVLLAQRTGVPVFVGADRYSAGLLAEQEQTSAKLAVHLLDDGFQHRKLAREIDIVLVTKEDVEDWLIPAGNLREPLSALREADVIVVREEEAQSLNDFVAGLARVGKRPAIWSIRRRLSLAESRGPLPAKPVAFCGIARPESFTSMLSLEGCLPVETVAFPDHHRYEEKDMAHLLEVARHKGADGFVTTEKDAVKLTPVMRERLSAVGPLLVARLYVELADEKNALLQLVAMVSRLDRRKH